MHVITKYKQRLPPLLLTDCISKINNSQVDNAKDMDIAKAMCNLTEYTDNYSKTSGSL